MFTLKLYTWSETFSNLDLNTAKRVISEYCPNDKANRLATIGGTFDMLHRGHKDYIHLAFECADFVYIFVTSEHFANSKRDHVMQSYEERLGNLEALIQRRLSVERNRYEILELQNEDDLRKRFTVDGDQAHCHHLVVVSPEYTRFFLHINNTRQARGLKSLVIVEKERSKNHKYQDISSSAIRKHDIDEFQIEDLSLNWDAPSRTHSFMFVR